MNHTYLPDHDVPACTVCGYDVVIGEEHHHDECLRFMPGFSL